MEKSKRKRQRLDSSSPYEPSTKVRQSWLTTTSRPVGLPEPATSSVTYSTPSQAKRLIVAIDFGTTCSGAAWYYSEAHQTSNVSLEEIHSITNWGCDPSERPYKRDDVPTEIQYDASLFDYLYGRSDKPRSLKAIFGFEIDHLTKDAGSIGHTATSQPLRLVKLLLSEDIATAPIRNQLQASIGELIAAGTIDNEDDVITHLFTYLLNSTLANVSKTSDVLPKATYVEFAIGIPPAWAARGRRREISALQRAIAATEFETRFKCSQNIFAITETEAAATFLLHGKHAFKHLDACAVVDIGGGTTDANVYRVTTYGSLDQLRLNEELITSTGVVCGANSPNRELYTLVLALLKNETYLEKDGLTLSSIVQSSVVRQFELLLKRKVDFDHAYHSRMRFYIQGLRAREDDKRFTSNHLDLEKCDVERIFEPFISKVKGLIREVVRKCRSQDVDLSKMILVGGGSESKPVANAIEKVLADVAPQVKLLHNANEGDQLAGFASNAVACGCFIRALDKEGGPKRFLDTNVCILRHQHFGDYDLHEQLAIEENALPEPPNPLWIQPSLDGDDYVFDVVDILIPKGQLVTPGGQMWKFDSTYVFYMDESQWDCTEVILASDNNNETGYPRGHPKNKDVDTVGAVTINVKHLLEGARRKVGPLKWVRASGKRSEHYEITLELQIYVQGLRLTAELRIPNDAGSGARTDLNIMSMFKPGAA